LAIRVTGRLRDRAGLDLSIQDLFQAPTIAELAEIYQTTLVAALALHNEQRATAGEREEVEL
jgi:hypothetical protein